MAFRHGPSVPTKTQKESNIATLPPSAQQAPRVVVKVVSISPGGQTKTVYENKHSAGETVSVSTADVPPFIIQVYIDGSIVKQITVGAKARLRV